MPTKTNALATAQQTLTDAKAELTQLKSERTAAESAVAAATARKLGARTDAKAFRVASSALADAEADLERTGLLVSDAEAAVRTAENAVQRATVQAEADAVAQLANEAAELADVFCISLGGHEAATARFVAKLNAYDKAREKLVRNARDASVAVDGSADVSRMSLASDLVEGLIPLDGHAEHGVRGLRRRGYASAIAASIRSTLGASASELPRAVGLLRAIESQASSARYD